MSQPKAERGMMYKRVGGERVELIPFVGIYPRRAAAAIAQKLDTHVYYEPHEGSDALA